MSVELLINGATIVIEDGLVSSDVLNAQTLIAQAIELIDANPRNKHARDRDRFLADEALKLLRRGTIVEHVPPDKPRDSQRIDY